MTRNVYNVESLKDKLLKHALEPVLLFRCEQTYNNDSGIKNSGADLCVCNYILYIVSMYVHSILRLRPCDFDLFQTIIIKPNIT